jgi:hypothetical protein
VVEFYSSSVSKDLKGEVEMGQRRFSGGSEGGMTALRFGSSRVEEGGSQWRTARRPGGPYRAERSSGKGRFWWE